MTIVSDIPAVTAADLVARALEAAQIDQVQRQREQERAQQAAEKQRQEALETEKIKFLRTLRDLWVDLVGMPLDLAIADDDLIYDGEHWLWQFQPGLKIGFDYKANRHPSVAEPFLRAFTAYNRSSYRVESLASLGHILEAVRSELEAVEERYALKQQREQEAAEERRRQQELESTMAEIDAREPEPPAPTAALFENGAAGVRVVSLAFALRLQPFRLNGDGGPMWEFDLNRGQTQALLDALDSRSEALIAPCGRLIITHPAGPGVERLDEVLWALLPMEYDTDYTTREMPGQVMVQRGVDTVAFKGALRNWIEYVARRDAWETERRAVLDAHKTAN
jgi:hypothetical protein